MKTIEGITGFKELAGQRLGESGWHALTQEMIDRFADATGDHQWIHVDRERAKAGPFGTTIAHGFLTLSLIPMLSGEVLKIDGIRMAINYGLNRVRFPAPVKAGARVRAAVRNQSVDDVEGGIQVVNEVTIEIEDGGKPACVAETVSRFYS
jgi:acyl dehydratase